MDIENSVGGVPNRRRQVEWAQNALARTIAPQSADQLVIGVSHTGFLTAGTGWLGPKRILPPQSGPDGADHALLRVLCEENIAARFKHVVLVSGDGIFSESIAEIGRAGVQTTVVARRGSLSRRLRMAAQEVLYLPDPPYLPGNFPPPAHQQSA